MSDTNTLRVLKLVSEYINSPDGTNGYEPPVGWRPISNEELALSKFNNEQPNFIEVRQFNWDATVAPYGKRRIHATMYWYADNTGIAFHKEWVWSPTKREGKWEIFSFAFGCNHQYKELSPDESRACGVAHYGNCWHVHKCTLCQHVNSYDSSD